MKRHPGKMALYEVMGKKSRKSFLKKNLEALKPVKKEKPAAPAVSPMPEKKVEKAVKWSNKPRYFQLNQGRVELSVPYQIAIAAVLFALVVILAAFKIGKGSAVNVVNIENKSEKTALISSKKVQKKIEPVKTVVKENTSELPSGIIAQKAPVNVNKNVQPSVPAGTENGSNIVIQTFRSRSDLVPVQDFFRSKGIATEIKKLGSWYYLVTANKYQGIKTQGTDGNNVLNKIVELGAQYEAPPGFESFRVKGKTPFHDAYGRKFED